MDTKGRFEEIVFGYLKHDTKISAEHLWHLLRKTYPSCTQGGVTRVLNILQYEGRVAHDNTVPPVLWYKKVIPSAPAPAPVPTGSITVIVGPMFSGKSKRLLNIAVDRYLLAGKEARLIKYGKDTRYTRADLIRSHDGQQFAATPLDSLDQFGGGDASPPPPDAIGIDEGIF